MCIRDSWYTDLLIEVKFYFVSQHLPDDSDKFAGTMPQGIVMSPAFRHLLIIVSFKGGFVLNDIMSCIHQGLSLIHI